MATDIIMPALGISQDKGRVLRWLKSEGQNVTQGEPLLEIETDKATVELEAPASGILANVTAREGDEVPVAQVIALILAPGERATSRAPQLKPIISPVAVTTPMDAASVTATSTPTRPINATPVARRLAQEHGIDLQLVKPGGDRIEKQDVLAFIETQKTAPMLIPPTRVAASPQARRLAAERGIDLGSLRGNGPDGAVVANDLPAVVSSVPSPVPNAKGSEIGISTVWRIMVERITQCWTTVPHFYLLREVNASRLIAWRNQVNNHAETKITFTDLLTKIVAAALVKHPRLNATWDESRIRLNENINIGVAAATDDGLVVPVIHAAHKLSVSEIAVRRQELVMRAQASKLRPDDITGGTFTISNLGMYGVDVFNAIINPPQAAILAVGRIAERVVPVNGQPGVQPMMMLSLSCDHRVVDGARGAQFLQTVAEWIEEPLALL